MHLRVKIASLVQDRVMEVVIYSKSDCKFCVKAKEWFSEKEIDYDEIVLNDYEERMTFYKENRVMTVPQIFIDGELFGNYQKLESSPPKVN